MTEFDLTELVLSWVTTYGSPMVAGILLVGALGVPVPGTLLVIASGAFVRQEFLSLYTTPIFGLIGAVAGDTIVYSVGRFARVWIENRFGRTAAWTRARDFFEQRGGLAIYLTRWLLTPVAVPTNLVAGSSGYPFVKFLLFDMAGELTWILLYGGLGYLFGSQWELISEVISNFTGVIVGVLLLAAGVYLLVRFRKNATAKATPASKSPELAQN